MTQVSSPTTATKACTVQVSGKRPMALQVERDDLLLKAALAQGIDFPHSCRVGVCGSCKTKVLTGRVSPMIDLALSPLTNAEIEAGFVLACQAKVRTDLDIAVDLAATKLIPSRTVASRVVSWRVLPGDVIDLRLALDEPMPYYAGQYGTIAESGSFTQRSYSFYDAPPADGSGATEVGFLIKRLPGGRFSEWVAGEDRTGTKIWLQGPFGLMGIAGESREILCVAGGTGLAPVLSIVAGRLRKDPQTRATIVFGVRTQAEQFAQTMLERQLGDLIDRVRLLTILSHEPQDSGWDGPRGLITEALTPELGIDFAHCEAFVCGSLPMVEAVEARLGKLGVDNQRIHADKFVPTG